MVPMNQGYDNCDYTHSLKSRSQCTPKQPTKLLYPSSTSPSQGDAAAAMILFARLSRGGASGCGAKDAEEDLYSDTDRNSEEYEISHKSAIKEELSSSQVEKISSCKKALTTSMPNKRYTKRKLRNAKGNPDDIKKTRINSQEVIYSRKEKSLGLLCENFLQYCNVHNNSQICLDGIAESLAVERRRIYDVVNILESINIVSKRSKNMYNWHGIENNSQWIEKLQERYQYIPQKEPRYSSFTDRSQDRRKEKSLAMLSQRFVQMFLQRKGEVLTLENAAKYLVEMDEGRPDEKLLKTKIRRLYDIANVLVSVGFVEKIPLRNSRKPAFRWAEMKPNLLPEKQMTSTYSSSSSSEATEKLSPVNENSSSLVSTDAAPSSSIGSDEISPIFKKSYEKNIEGNTPISQSLPKTYSMNKYSLLKFSSRDSQKLIPLHPDHVLKEQEEQVERFMELYKGQYEQWKKDNLTLDLSDQQMNMTPVTLPCIYNRVTDRMMNSWDNLYGESPQSVADLALYINRTNVVNEKMEKGVVSDIRKQDRLSFVLR